MESTIHRGRRRNSIVSQRGSGQPKEFRPKPKEGNPKSSISAESRNCRKRTVSAESVFFRPKGPSFGRKSSNISAEIAVFRPKLNISAEKALMAEREILPKCFGANRNRKFRPKSEREPCRLTTTRVANLRRSRISC